MLNIVIIEMGRKATGLAEYLGHAGHRCLSIEGSDQFLQLAKPALPDLVIFVAAEPSGHLLAALQALNQSAPLPVIVFADTCPDDGYSRVIEAQVSAFVVNGLDFLRLPSIIQVALARFKHLQALKNALEEARAQLEDRKQIDRAKAILIKARNFSENEAYHTLRKLAMDRNITLGEMARNVIAMADLLK